MITVLLACSTRAVGGIFVRTLLRLEEDDCTPVIRPVVLGVWVTKAAFVGSNGVITCVVIRVLTHWLAVSAGNGAGRAGAPRFGIQRYFHASFSLSNPVRAGGINAICRYYEPSTLGSGFYAKRSPEGNFGT